MADFSIGRWDPGWFRRTRNLTSDGWLGTYTSPNAALARARREAAVSGRPVALVRSGDAFALFSIRLTYGNLPMTARRLSGATPDATRCRRLRDELDLAEDVAGLVTPDGAVVQLEPRGSLEAGGAAAAGRVSSDGDQVGRSLTTDPASASRRWVACGLRAPSTLGVRIGG